MSAVPDLDVDALHLREATFGEKIQSWRNNSEAWRGALTVEQHIGLQIVNGSQALTRNGGIRYWVFTDGEEIYCSAETLRKPSIRLQTAGGDVLEEDSYGVAAVFTPTRYRRRGIASAMMRKLALWFDQRENCSFTTLFSAVGDFYQRFGWDAVPTPEIRISVDGTRTISSIGKWEVDWMNKAMLQDFCEEDVRQVTDALSTTSGVDHTASKVATLPTYETAQWHFGAEEYLSLVLPNLPPHHVVNKGAMTRTSGIWCYWVHDFNSSKLTVLRLVMGHALAAGTGREKLEEELGQLLGTATVEAAHWGLREVAIWGSDIRVLAACKRAGLEAKVRDEIENYLPCIRPKGGSMKGPEEVGVDWTLLQAYQRC